MRYLVFFFNCSGDTTGTNLIKLLTNDGGSVTWGHGYLRATVGGRGIQSRGRATHLAFILNDSRDFRDLA